MAEYEPDDSRVITQNPSTTPGEPPRTGPREGETRAQGDPKSSEARNKPSAGTGER